MCKSSRSWTTIHTSRINYWAGFFVLGTLAELPSLISRLGADEVIIAMPKARGSVIRRVVQAASDAGIQARTIPGFDDLISGESQCQCAATRGDPGSAPA